MDARAALSADARRAAERAAGRGSVAATPAAARYVIALAEQRLSRDAAGSTRRRIRLGLAVAGPFVIAGMLLFAEPPRSLVVWTVLITLGLWWDVAREPQRIRAARAALAANASLADPPRRSTRTAKPRGPRERAVAALSGGLVFSALLAATTALDEGWAAASTGDVVAAWIGGALGMWFALLPSEPKIFTPRA